MFALATPLKFFLFSPQLTLQRADGVVLQHDKDRKQADKCNEQSRSDGFTGLTVELGRPCPAGLHVAWALLSSDAFYTFAKHPCVLLTVEACNKKKKDVLAGLSPLTCRY